MLTLEKLIDYSGISYARDVDNMFHALHLLIDIARYSGFGDVRLELEKRYSQVYQDVKDKQIKKQIRYIRKNILHKF